MPQDQDNNNGAPAAVGRTYRGEASPPSITPDAVARRYAAQAAYAKKPGAVDVRVYFVSRGLDSPILQASMLAYTDVRVATAEDFDAIFAEHDGPKQAEEAKNP